jgi:hypothetical protein
MLQLLERVHKLVGATAGEIAVALSRRRLQGGKASLLMWAHALRTAADELEREANK